jgi:hypothetical protein
MDSIYQNPKGAEPTEITRWKGGKKRQTKRKTTLRKTKKNRNRKH